MSAGRAIATFISLWILWILFTGSLNGYELVVGGICSAFVAGISYELFSRNPGDMINPKKWAHLIAYFPAYVWAEIKAHLNVTYRILHPNLPLEPAIVKLPSTLESDVGITSLANSITMTPGTLSVDINEDKSELFVHWISTESLDEEDVHDEIGEPFERFLRGGLG